MTSKACAECCETKPLDDFHINKKGKFGRQSKCKKCISALFYLPRKDALCKASKERRSTEDGKAKEREWQRTRRRSNPLVRMVQEAKVRASKKDREFSITADDLELPTICPVLGIPIGMQFGARSDNSLSLDRIDGNKGYIPGNVRVISWRANRLKNDASIEELRAILRYMEAGI